MYMIYEVLPTYIYTAFDRKGVYLPQGRPSTRKGTSLKSAGNFESDKEHKDQALENKDQDSSGRFS